MARLLSSLLLLSYSDSFVPRGAVVRSAVALNARRADPRRDEDTRSLAEKMFGDVTKVFSFGKEEEEKVVVEQGPLDASRAISEIDQRAASGEVTYQDFIAMSRTFAELNGEVPGMPKLSPSEVAETKRKFEKHERIVQAMSQEELKDPQLMVDDIDSINNGETKGPRVQRLALESGVPEKDVLLFVAEFEAMRESTSRIAAGEDPDKVNASLGDGKGNRSQRRAIAKAKKKAAKKGSML